MLEQLGVAVLDVDEEGEILTVAATEAVLDAVVDAEIEGVSVGVSLVDQLGVGETVLSGETVLVFVGNILAVRVAVGDVVLE